MTRRRGLTLVELCLAMIITAMVGVSVVAFTTMTGRAWRESEYTQQLDVSAQQAGGMIAAMVESSRALGAVGASPPAVFLWLTDSFDGTADAKAQLAEMALIEYDAALKTVFLYQADLVKAQLLRGDADDVLYNHDISNLDFAALFKTQQGWLAPRRALMGPGRTVDDDQTITRVESATFTRLSTSGLPAVEMNVTLSRGSERRVVRSVLTVRAPTARPDAN